MNLSPNSSQDYNVLTDYCESHQSTVIQLQGTLQSFLKCTVIPQRNSDNSVDLSTQHSNNVACKKSPYIHCSNFNWYWWWDRFSLGIHMLFKSKRYPTLHYEQALCRSEVLNLKLFRTYLGHLQYIKSTCNKVLNSLNYFWCLWQLLCDPWLLIEVFQRGHSAESLGHC